MTLFLQASSSSFLDALHAPPPPLNNNLHHQTTDCDTITLCPRSCAQTKKGIKTMSFQDGDGELDQ